MRGISILIKPASDACNMACEYCFYRDVADSRQNAFMGMLSLDTMEALIKNAAATATETITFAFQGGEPTLAGLDFFTKVVALQKRYLKKGLQIHNAIQTNGYATDAQWASFFHDNHFLVGVSLDGPSDIHNRYRLDKHGKSTFNRVMTTLRLFDKHQVDYNILSVVTGYNARHIRQIYHFFSKEHFRFLQFIPCLEPLNALRGEAAYHLSVSEYGHFLVSTWDLWFADLKLGKYLSIRHIDNWLSILMGRQPEACSMMGRCSTQFVVEGDGSVYPCDFFVTDAWRLGNIQEESLEALWQSAPSQQFMESSLQIKETCKTCQWYGLCRCGCRRDRFVQTNDGLQENYYCAAYQHFFEKRFHEMQQAVRMIQQID